jgi:hypothetical protein
MSRPDRAPTGAVQGKQRREALMQKVGKFVRAAAKFAFDLLSNPF